MGETGSLSSRFLALQKGSRKLAACKMFTAQSPDCQRLTVWELRAMNISRRKRVLVFLFSFLIDLKILAWPFAFCPVQSHESLIRGSKEKHRTVYSLSLHQFPAHVFILGPMCRPFQFRDEASPALLSALRVQPGSAESTV